MVIWYFWKIKIVLQNQDFNQYLAHKKLTSKGAWIELVMGQFGHGCDPYALVKRDKIDICLSEMYEIAVQAIISECTKYSKYIKSVRGTD